MVKRRFVIGDIHGAHRALLQCFERSGFDRQNDLLICLGDLCDGWPDVDKVFDELLAGQEPGTCYWVIMISGC